MLLPILGTLSLLGVVYFLLPLAIGVCHVGMFWPAALLLLAALCLGGCGYDASVEELFALPRMAEGYTDLAQQLDADYLVILTAVEKVAVNFGKPDQQWLDSLTPDQAREYMDQGQFAPGSMLPKVQAAVQFAESKPGRSALITLLEKARDGIAGRTGTSISL